ncbi:lactonase family protein [Flavobacterium psychrotolerans]|uniref:6-phosphogluconolactonase n=1 Tax=Flavobacterium psychrotolerans TaxID=2169410 RepID=A0A2U1JJP8_9FLAO|nr:lactonase family protein [Flavobacterium psychrotolerans]PWA05390.1 6-phosphogluconolactonase [Flavobacterium psychrotolerans]
MKMYPLVLLAVLFSFQSRAQQNNFNLIVGTYTNSCESKGIYVYDFNAQTADFKLKSTSEKVINPSYLTVSADNKQVYSVNENGAQSGVSAFAFNSKSGSLQLINQQSSKGADPCYIINDSKNVIVATYSGGSISVFGKNKNGSLSDFKQVIRHHGKSVNAQRQESPHVHMVQFTPDKKFVLANDLGTDKIYVYQYNPNAKAKILEIKDSVAVKSGSGPRHLTFSRNGKFTYLLQELDGSLTVFSYKNGGLKMVQETQVVSVDFKGDIGAADIHVSPNGKFLYATNRGTANTISCFEILKNGHLKSIETIATLGKGPRNFTIDPTGKFLLVAHQYSNDVVVFHINAVTGKLTDTGKRIELCAPVCLVFGK